MRWLLIILFFMPNILMAQEAYPFKLKGYLGVKGGETFNYEMELKLIAPGKYEGFARTFSEPQKDVKTAVTMYLDQANGKAMLVENNIVHNNGFTSKVLICLLEAELSHNAKEKTLSGRIVTKMVSGTLPCSDGSLIFTNVQEIDQFLREKLALDDTQLTIAASNTNPTSPKPKVDDKPKVYVDKRTQPSVAAPKPTITAPKVTTITEGKDDAIFWENATLKMYIKDDNTVDGDMVTVMYNGEIVLDNYKLTATPKEISLPVGNNELNILSILATSEGAEPPNTASIQLKDGEKTYDILAHNKVGKVAIIKIKKRI